MAKEVTVADNTAYSICTVPADSSNGLRRIANILPNTKMDPGTFATIVVLKVTRGANRYRALRRPCKRHVEAVKRFKLVPEASLGVLSLIISRAAITDPGSTVP